MPLSSPLFSPPKSEQTIEVGKKNVVRIDCKTNYSVLL